MSDAVTPQAAQAPAPVEAGGFLQNLLDLYFSPREAFARIVRAPRILAPLVLYAACVLGFTYFALTSARQVASRARSASSGGVMCLSMRPPSIDSAGRAGRDAASET